MKNPIAIFRIMAVAAVSTLMLFSGCIKQKILVKVKPDGSGNIVVCILFTKKIVNMIERQMEEQRKKLAESGLPKENINSVLQNPFFNEMMLEEAADNFGDNIEYIRAKEISNSAGKGAIAVYSFDNINDVKLDLQKLGPLGAQFGNTSSSDKTITFSFKKGKPAVLKVNIPQLYKKNEVMDSENSENVEKKVKSVPLTEQEKAQMMAQGNILGLTGKEKTREELMRKMFADMSIDLSLEVVGKLIKSNATFKNPVKKNRCTLFAMDLNELLESDGNNDFLSEKNLGNVICAVLNSNKNINNIKGVTIENKKKLILEFEEK